MAKIGLFYGSSTGETENAAQRIQQEFGGDGAVTLYNVGECSVGDLANYQCVIVGCPTWDVGDLQPDWDRFLKQLDSVSFDGKKVAYFGTGDQVGYPATFQDAIGIIETKIAELKGETVGYWPTDNYDFIESLGDRGGKFVGLALDEDNQSELSEPRIKQWVAQLKSEFGV
ncbi:MAG: flavodoxin FldA [Cyanobacteria bacterium P01_D01_bin.73]